MGNTAHCQDGAALSLDRLSQCHSLIQSWRVLKRLFSARLHDRKRRDASHSKRFATSWASDYRHSLIQSWRVLKRLFSARLHDRKRRDASHSKRFATSWASDYRHSLIQSWRVLKCLFSARLHVRKRRDASHSKRFATSWASDCRVSARKSGWSKARDGPRHRVSASLPHDRCRGLAPPVQ